MAAGIPGGKRPGSDRLGVNGIGSEKRDERKTDRLNGLKENVIIGKLIPAATGLKRYRRIEIEPSEPLPRAIDDVGLLDEEEIAAELGLSGNAGYGQEFDSDLASLEKIGAGDGDSGFVEELVDLEVPESSGE